MVKCYNTDICYNAVLCDLLNVDRKKMHIQQAFDVNSDIGLTLYEGCFGRFRHVKICCINFEHKSYF